jgi:hypothetical protein
MFGFRGVFDGESLARSKVPATGKPFRGGCVRCLRRRWGQDRSLYRILRSERDAGWAANAAATSTTSSYKDQPRPRSGRRWATRDKLWSAKHCTEFALPDIVPATFGWSRIPTRSTGKKSGNSIP